MSLLTICQDAAALVGIDAPSSVIASSDATNAQFGALAQVEGDELARYFDWRGLKIETSFTGDGSTVLFELPAGFDRWMSGGMAFFEDGTYNRLEGPVSDETFTAYQAANSDPNQPVWRMIGPDVEFFPALDTGVVVTSLYLTGYWITDAAGTTRKARWTLDSDLSTLPDRLITLGAVSLEDGELVAQRTLCLIFDPMTKSNPFAQRVHGFDEWTLRHQDMFGSYARKVRDWLVPGTIYGDKKIFEFAKSAGIIALYESGTFGAQDCIDKTGFAKVSIEKGKPDPKGGTYPDKNVIRWYISKPAGARPAPEVRSQVEPVKPEVAATENDEDVPF